LHARQIIQSAISLTAVPLPLGFGHRSLRQATQQMKWKD